MRALCVLFCAAYLPMPSPRHNARMMPQTTARARREAKPVEFLTSEVKEAAELVIVAVGSSSLVAKCPALRRVLCHAR